MIRRLRSLRRDQGGATIIEFAIIVPVMSMMMMGLGDMVYQLYARQMLAGALQKAGRDSAVEGGANQTSQLDQRVLTMMASIMPRPSPSCGTDPAAATYCSTRLSYATFSAVGPEPFDDNNGNNRRDVGECYTDNNGNGRWDAEPGTAGQGGASDVTLYTMRITYTRPFPVARLFGASPTQTVSAQTLLKNQPYAAQNMPTVTRLCN